MLIRDLTVPVPPPAPVPHVFGSAMPWTCVEHPGATPGIVQRHKILRGGFPAGLMRPEDEEVLAYVAHLERDNNRLRALLAGTEITPGTNGDKSAPEQTLGGALEALAPPANAPPTEGAVPLAPEPDAAPAPPNKRAQAEQELLRTPGDSNGQIAERIGCSDEFVRLRRKELEAAGKLAPRTTAAPEG